MSDDAIQQHKKVRFGLGTLFHADNLIEILLFWHQWKYLY